MHDDLPDARHSRRAGRQVTGREARQLAGSTAGRVLIGAVVAIAVATLVGLVALWPADRDPQRATVSTAAPTTAGTVERVVDGACPGTGGQRCRRLIITVNATRTTLALGPVETAADVRPGTRIRVSKLAIAPGTPGAEDLEPYAFAGVDRHRSVLWLALALAALALVALRRRGLLAVVGVGLSLLLLTTFVVPALLAGRPAILVALVGSLAVMFVTLVLTNGVGAQTLAAALGVSVTRRDPRAAPSAEHCGSVPYAPRPGAMIGSARADGHARAPSARRPSSCHAASKRWRLHVSRVPFKGFTTRRSPLRFIPVSTIVCSPKLTSIGVPCGERHASYGPSDNPIQAMTA